MKINKLWPYILILVIGFILRLAWNPHQIIWSYDQARDSFFMREMIMNKNLILLGPQSEVYGLFHGPLYYYLFSPFYYLSKGEPWLPLIVMSIINLAAGVPLTLISIKISKSKLAGILTFAVFCFSYAFTEYSRWLSNFSITLPLITWAYYLFLKILERKTNKTTLFLLGLVLGLATQGEIFFLSIVAVFFLCLVFSKINLKGLINYALGVGFGMIPILIAQFKFGFMGTRIFTEIISGGFQKLSSGVSASFLGYVNHLGLTFYQTIGGASVPVGLLLFVLLLGLVAKKINKVWLISILIGHAVLFAFEYIDVVFLDIGLALLLPVLVGVGCYFLFKANKFLFVVVAVFYFVFQFGLYNSYVVGRDPFGSYNFIHKGASTLSDYDDIAAKMYEASNNKKFTLSVIGTPFGVRTVWASVFELYSRKHNVPVPKWFEYYANGYPGEEILVSSDKPAKNHFLVLEANIKNLLSAPIIVRELGNQDNNTVKIDEFVVRETTIQVRKPI